MLVDLEWTLEHAGKREHTEWIKEFNTNDGHLYMVVEFPPSVNMQNDEFRIWKRFVAERAGKGVYWACNLWNDIETYTNWSVEHPWEESKKVWDAMVEAREAGDLEGHANLRDKLLRFKKVYGNADNLKQVFKYGHQFINGKHPYVLEIRTHDVSGPDGDRYLDKNGGYIGKKRVVDLKEIVHFSFHKIIPKVTTCLQATPLN